MSPDSSAVPIPPACPASPATSGARAGTALPGLFSSCLWIRCPGMDLIHPSCPGNGICVCKAIPSRHWGAMRDLVSNCIRFKDSREMVQIVPSRITKMVQGWKN